MAFLNVILLVVIPLLKNMSFRTKKLLCIRISLKGALFLTLVVQWLFKKKENSGIVLIYILFSVELYFNSW